MYLQILRKKLTWLTKGLRHIILPGIYTMFPLKKLTWLTKGLRHNTDSYNGNLYRRRNWPDLRRDCDVILMLICSTILLKKLTWLTKGLRRLKMSVKLAHSGEEIDLTYEGIATLCNSIRFDFPFWRRNWPDLRRDCDLDLLKLLLYLQEKWRKCPD